MSGKINFMENAGLAPLEEIFSVSPAAGGEITEIPLNELHTFTDHPYRVLDDERMTAMAESVREHGVLVPGIARPAKGGGYELLSGHRRKRASELAGKKTMPVMIRDCDDDEATIIMVDANLQREDILPSEKARAYAMKYEALKHQGKAGGDTLQRIGEEAGEGGKTVQRYIYLARLTDELLSLVDSGKLGMRQGVDLSFLSEEAQEWVSGLIGEKKGSVSMAEAEELKESFRAGELTEDKTRSILSRKVPARRKVSFTAKRLDPYFPEGTSNEKIEEIILKLLDAWKEDGGKDL